MLKFKSNEQKLVILLTKYELSKSEISELNKLMKSYLDWSQVIGYMQMHRVLTIAWDNIVKYYYTQPDYRCSYNKFLGIVKENYKLAQKKIQVQLQNTITICNEFKKKEIDYVLLKGLTLVELAYSKNSPRVFNDNDILLSRSDIKKVSNIIESLGYIQGDIDPLKKEIIPANRKEIMMRPMISHEIYPYLKPLSQGMVLDYHELDVHFSIDVMTNNKTDNIVKEMLSNKQSITVGDSSHINAMNFEDMLIFTCIHFYKEAIYDFKIRAYSDLSLYKMCDIHYFIFNNYNKINWAEFIKRVKSYGFEKEVYFALYFTDQIYSLNIDDQLELVKPNNVEYINKYYSAESNEEFEWRDSIHERIFDFNRAGNIDIPLLK